VNEDQDRTLHHMYGSCQVTGESRTFDYNCDAGLYAMFFVIFAATSILHHPLQASALQTPLPPTIIKLALAHSTAPITQSTISYSGLYELGNPWGVWEDSRLNVLWPVQSAFQG